MSESKETWVFDPDNEGNSFLSGYGLLDQDGMEIGIFIETGDDFDDEEQRAKAHLVAAAPNLLQACEEVLNEMRAWSGEEEFNEIGLMKPMFDQLKAAIAKAKGKDDE